ncbi:F-box only protein 36a [Danio rerio]|uniref:F-box only protein 36a n=1 Tax=Danio rerio TaxID=7955 RepID=Q0D281_DANRE|nr:F-box only protein 36a [Danio rerio]AAI22395.1 Zgc:153717 [Danio rerio]|eukprot:NP_001070215.1 F-box only protein 36 [Danio rerio]
MASLLDEILFETAGQGPPPSKDFYQLVITRKEVIWRCWKTSIRAESRGAPPGETKQFHDDFLNDSRMQEQLAVVIGSGILEYTLALCRGHFDYLERLPDKLLLTILSYISLQDIGHLSQTSNRFRKLCNSEEIWKKTVLGHCDGITEDMEMLAKVMGWKKIFFGFYHEKDPVSTASPAKEEDNTNRASP